MLVQFPDKAQAGARWAFDEEAGEEVVNAAISLRPLLQENAAKGDVQRYPAPEVIAAFDKADLWAVAVPQRLCGRGVSARSEEHTSELQSLIRISYAVFCLTTKTNSPQL